MRHIAMVSKLPVVATTDTTGIISYLEKTVSEVISAVGIGIKAAVNSFGTPASS